MPHIMCCVYCDLETIVARSFSIIHHIWCLSQTVNSHLVRRRGQSAILAYFGRIRGSLADNIAEKSLPKKPWVDEQLANSPF